MAGDSDEELFTVLELRHEEGKDFLLSLASVNEPNLVRRILLKEVIEARVLLAEGLSGPLTYSKTDPLLWDHGPASTIFGNAPLPDPQRFFHEFFELVDSLTEGARDALKYLAWSGRFNEWRNSVINRTYRLLTAPAPLAEAATELLERQAAEYILLPDPPSAESSGAYAALRCAKTWFVCAEIRELTQGSTEG